MCNGLLEFTSGATPADLFSTTSLFPTLRVLMCPSKNLNNLSRTQNYRKNYTSISIFLKCLQFSALVIAGTNTKRLTIIIHEISICGYLEFALTPTYIHWNQRKQNILTCRVIILSNSKIGVAWKSNTKNYNDNNKIHSGGCK